MPDDRVAVDQPIKSGISRHRTMTNIVQYTALLRREGKQIAVEFPDCPGCATFADAGEDPLAVARDALEGWLEAHLVDGDSPPEPSAIHHPPGVEFMPVGVNADLERRLRDRWAANLEL